MLGRKQNHNSSAGAVPPVSVQHLEDLLLQANLITQGQLTEAVKTREEMGGFIGQILVQLKYVTQDAISSCLVKHCKIPHLSLLDYDIGADMLDFVPQEICKKRGLIPIDKLGRILTVAMVDPLDSEALEEVRQACPELRIKPILCNWAHFEMVSRKLFSGDEAASTSEMSMASLGLSSAPAKVISAVKEEPPPQADIPLAAELPPDQAFSAVDQDALAATVRESVESAMNVIMEKGGVGGAASESALTDMIRDMRNETLNAFRELINSNQASQKEQQNHLAEIAEAVLQSVQKASIGRGDFPDVNTADTIPVGSDLVQNSPWTSGALLESQGRVNLTFETFLPGEINTFPFRVSQAIAQTPGGEYNPLFLCGHVGVGKTHLAIAIGNAIQESNPDARIGSMTASDFAQSLNDAKNKQCVHDFRAAHSNWDVLILDDIQFLGGHVEAQEEFFHIFNVLHQAGKQIVIAGDKAPQQLGLMEKRLVSRFDSGIVAELQAPDLTVRMDILREQLAGSSEEVPEEVCTLIAETLSADVRRMTGALRKVLAYAKLTQTKITCEMAAEILEQMRSEEAA